MIIHVAQSQGNRAPFRINWEYPAASNLIFYRVRCNRYPRREWSNCRSQCSERPPKCQSSAPSSSWCFQPAFWLSLLAIPSNRPVTFCRPATYFFSGFCCFSQGLRLLHCWLGWMRRIYIWTIPGKQGLSFSYFVLVSFPSFCLLTNIAEIWCRLLSSLARAASSRVLRWSALRFLL